MPATDRPSTIIHIDKLTIQLNNALYDAEDNAARHHRKFIFSNVKQAMRAFVSPLKLIPDSAATPKGEQEDQQPLQPLSPASQPLDNKSRFPQRFPSVIGALEESQPQPQPQRQPIVPDAVSQIFD